MNLKCPSCGNENQPGEDRCRLCLHSLMEKAIPTTKKKDFIQKAMLTHPVSALLTGKDLLVCSPQDSVQKVVKIFQKEKKTCILVYKGKRMVGILSNRDILLRVAGLRKELGKIPVEEVMTRNPDSVRPEDPIAFAVNRMSMGGYRHLPVLRADGTPVSILLIKDVLRYLSKSKAAY